MSTRAWRRALLWCAVAVVAGGAAGIALRGLDVHPVRVTSGSMAPTVEVGDWVVVRDLDQENRRTVERGDIVSFRFPLGTTGRAVKRVVAVEGDRVAISSRSVAVNGRVITVGGALSAAAARRRVETIPPGHVFLLGDNGSASIDSRSFGPVPRAELVARQLLVLGAPGWTWAITAVALVACAAIARTTAPRA